MTIDNTKFRGLYHFNSGGVGTDSSGNNNDLTIVGASSVTGKLNEAIKFDGIDDYAENASILTDLATDTQGTIAFWMFLPSNNGVQNVSFGISNSSSATITEIHMNADLRNDGANNLLIVQCVVDDVAQWVVRTPINSLSSHIGSWISIIIKHNGTQISDIKISNVSQILTRGVTIDETTWFKSIITDASTKADLFSLGVLNRDGLRIAPFEGRQDEFLISSDVWSNADDSEYWNGGNGKEFGIGTGYRRKRTQQRMLNV